MKKRRQNRKKAIKEIVSFSIERLLKEAQLNYKTHPKRTKRYLSLVLKFVSRYKFPLKKEQKSKFCKKCLIWWSRENVLISKSKNPKLLTYKCNNCNAKRTLSKSHTNK